MNEILILKEPSGVINNPRVLFNKIEEIKINYSQENFLVFYLDTKKKLINSEILFKGGLNLCLIDSKTLFRQALINNADSIIIAHNHPSGDLTPSKEDKEVFKTLKKVGDIIKLNVIDSIIFNTKEYYSLEV